MSATDVEPYIAALVAALQADPTLSSLVTSFGRRIKFWNDVSEQPALFVRHIADEYKYNHDDLPIVTIECEIWVYERSGANPDAISDTALNTIATAIKNIMAVDQEDGRYTLGGLVYWCRVEGKAEYKPGDTDAQGLMLLPVKMMLWPI